MTHQASKSGWAREIRQRNQVQWADPLHVARGNENQNCLKKSEVPQVKHAVQGADWGVQVEVEFADETTAQLKEKCAMQCPATDITTRWGCRTLGLAWPPGVNDVISVHFEDHCGCQ